MKGGSELYFILNLLTFLLFTFGFIFCMLTTNKNKKDMLQRIFGDKTPTPEQNNLLNGIFIKLNALGVFLVVLGIGFIIARIF